MKTSTKLKLASICVVAAQIVEDIISPIATNNMINWGVIELSPENVKAYLKRLGIRHAISFGTAATFYGAGMVLEKIENKDDEPEDIGKDILDAINTIMPDTEANNASDSDKES